MEFPFDSDPFFSSLAFCRSEKMSLEYFELAGKLGDPDAAAEAGALWAAGKGCKKDLKKAAAFYRMAVSLEDLLFSFF